MATTQTQPQLEVLPTETESASAERPRTRSRKAGALQKVEPSTAPIQVSPAPQTTDMEVFARIASDPNVDLAKLEKLIAMKERMDAAKAKAEFDADFAEMQGELPEIDERGRIVVEGQLRSNYAKNEDIQKFVRPVMKKHGFALSFREERTDDGKMAIVGILSHRGGHREEDRFITAPDDSGKKNSIQARGSSRSYGQRYTTIFLLNISTREPGFGADDDGQASERPAAPEGFEQFVVDLRAAAKAGNKVLYPLWNKAEAKLRQHMTKHYRSEWASMKAEAEKVGS